MLSHRCFDRSRAMAMRCMRWRSRCLSHASYQAALGQCYLVSSPQRRMRRRGRTRGTLSSFGTFRRGLPTTLVRYHRRTTVKVYYFYYLRTAPSVLMHAGPQPLILLLLLLLLLILLIFLILLILLIFILTITPGARRCDLDRALSGRYVCREWWHGGLGQRMVCCNWRSGALCKWSARPVGEQRGAHHCYTDYTPSQRRGWGRGREGLCCRCSFHSRRHYR